MYQPGTADKCGDTSCDLPDSGDNNGGGPGSSTGCTLGDVVLCEGLLLLI